MSGADEVNGTAAAGPVQELELRRGAAPPERIRELGRVAAGFEALFASSLLRELLQPLQDGGGLAGQGAGASVVSGLLETHLADHVAKSGGFGIGRMVVESMRPLLAAQKVTVESLTRMGSQTRMGEGKR